MDASCLSEATSAALAALPPELLLPAATVDRLFPELHLDTRLVARVRIRHAGALLCQDRLVLLDPRLELLSRRDERLDVGLCTDILVGPGAALALRREQILVELPDGAWTAPDRQTLKRKGRVEVGSLMVDIRP